MPKVDRGWRICGRRFGFSRHQAPALNREYLSLGFSSTIYACYTEYIHIEN